MSDLTTEFIIVYTRGYILCLRIIVTNFYLHICQKMSRNIYYFLVIHKLLHFSLINNEISYQIPSWNMKI